MCSAGVHGGCVRLSAVVFGRCLQRLRNVWGILLPLPLWSGQGAEHVFGCVRHYYDFVFVFVFEHVLGCSATF